MNHNFIWTGNYLDHKLDTTEGASAQFLIWIFNFLAIWAAQGNTEKKNGWAIMSNFLGRFKRNNIYIYFFKYCSVR